jgi:hypothetical protein
MEKVTTVGIDLAKSVFSLHGVDGAGRVLLAVRTSSVRPNRDPRCAGATAPTRPYKTSLSGSRSYEAIPTA